MTGASVGVDFTGDVNGRVSATTNINGVATLRSTEAARQPVCSACVVSVTGTTLDDQPGSERC